MYQAIRSWLPGPLRRSILHFETALEQAAIDFATAVPAGSKVLDAGAGETQYKRHFERHRYIGVDLGIGDTKWDYSELDVVGDLSTLPFQSDVFDAALNIVTLEHVTDPQGVLTEICRVLKPGGKLLLAAPHEWEEHQQPHDYYRYTRFGLRHLLTTAGFVDVETRPVGGFFRLLSRRLLNALQFFPGPFMPIAALFLAPPALVMPWFDSLDRQRNFTLGYICHARKAS